jgi:hypothetical protein
MLDAETTVNQGFRQSSLQKFTTCPILLVSRLYPNLTGDYIWNLKSVSSIDNLRPLRMKKSNF